MITSPSLLPPPLVNPEIENVVQVNIGKNRRNHRALRSSLLCLDPPPLLHHARFEPFLDQADDSPVSDPMLDELDHPGMIESIEGHRHTLPTLGTFPRG